MTESPRRNILGMTRLRSTRWLLSDFPALECSIHISVTSYRTMLQCRSKALTLARSFLLLRTLIKTCVSFSTARFKMDNGPTSNSSAFWVSTTPSGASTSLNPVRDSVSSFAWSRFLLCCKLRLAWLVSCFYGFSVLCCSVSGICRTVGRWIRLDMTYLFADMLKMRAVLNDLVVSWVAATEDTI